MQAEINENNPYELIGKWIADENGSFLFGILATVDDQCRPHTRTIAIREINDKGVLFFTQKGSNKVQQLENNPSASLTLYLPLHKRQITFKGIAEALSSEENTLYWKTYPKESQLRFLVYGPRSGENISSNAELDRELEELRENYRDRSPERPDSYIGYRIHPFTLEFYQLNSDRLSDSFVVHHEGDKWEFARVVP